MALTQKQIEQRIAERNDYYDKQIAKAKKILNAMTWESRRNKYDTFGYRHMEEKRQNALAKLKYLIHKRYNREIIHPTY